MVGISTEILCSASQHGISSSLLESFVRDSLVEVVENTVNTASDSDQSLLMENAQICVTSISSRWNEISTEQNSVLAIVFHVFAMNKYEIFSQIIGLRRVRKKEQSLSFNKPSNGERKQLLPL